MYEIFRMKKDDGLPMNQIKPENSIPETLWSIWGGKSPRSIAVPIKFAQRPTNRHRCKGRKIEPPTGVKYDRGKHNDNNNVINEHGDVSRKHADAGYKERHVAS